MSLDTAALSPDTVSGAPAEACPGPALTAADLLGRVVAACNLDQEPLTPPPWQWDGYLGPGKVTLLTSQWKSGKTTLVSLLLARLQQGGHLLGLAVAPGQALVVSEESPADWRPRFRQLGIRDHVDLLCRPFATQPTHSQWLALIEAAAALHERQGTGVVVIDSLAQFLPAHSENSASAMLECLTPLQRLTSAGLSVLLLHHPRKGKTVAGQAARGTGALPGFADIIMEMSHCSGPEDEDRRRRLVAFSRHAETPRHLLIELLPDGSDYVVLQCGPEEADGQSWETLLAVLASAHRKLTQQELLDDWPADADRPGRTSLWRWLKGAVARGQVCREGKGHVRDPYRYWLPAREEMLFPDDGTPEEQRAWHARVVAEWWAGLNPSGGADDAVAPPPSSGGSGTNRRAAAAAGPRTGRLASPVTDPGPAPAPEPSAPPARESAVRLPYPFNQMNPADVPEDVWERAREAERNR